MKKVYLFPFIIIGKLIIIILILLRRIFLGIYSTIKKISEIIYMFFKYVIFGIVYVSHIFYLIIFYFFKYLSYGIIYSLLLAYIYFSKFIINFIYGFIIVSFSIYKILKYFIYGIYFPFVFITDKTRLAQDTIKDKKEKNNLEKIRKSIERKRTKEREQERRVLEKIRITEKKKQLKEEKRIARQKRRQKDEYLNENMTIDKKNFNFKLNQFLNYFNNLPQKISNSLNKWYNNLPSVKNKKNKYEMEHQKLLINFEGEDAVKNSEKIPYEYEVKDVEGKIIKGHYEAFSKVEVHSFLLSENYEVYSIKTSPWIQFKYGRNKQSKAKFQTKDLIFFLTQLSTYIKAGITLIESLRILSRQYKQNKYKQILRNVIYELTMGENFSDALLKQGSAFPRLLINMIKTSEMTGELPESLDDMADYYTETDKTKKQMVTAMMYPLIVLIVATAVIVFVLMYVVPQFTEIYSSMDNSKVPDFTLFVMSISAFLKKNALTILFSLIVIIIIFKYLFDHIKSIKTITQWLLMHTPVFGNVIIYNEVTMFTKTFASLLKHNVFITDSMEILTKVTNNEIYKMIILDTIANLAHGDRLSMAFKNHWAFPMPAYEMLVTGEKTGQLPEMMAKVSIYYQEMHKNSVTRIQTFIEPILIIFLTVIVGGIVLAIIVPMFSLYQSVQA